MERIKKNELDFSAPNIVRMKQLLQGIVFQENQEFKDCQLFGLLYCSLVDSALNTMGISGKGEPYYTWLVMTYDKEQVENAVKELNMLSTKGK